MSLHKIVKTSDLLAWRSDWLAENDPMDGTDCVTPFDKYLYGDELLTVPEYYSDAAEKRTLTITGILIAVLIALILLGSNGARADEARNWCADWADGYYAGLCWNGCPAEPAPAMCPYPEPDEVDGYMRGLREGLKDGSEQA